MRKFLLSAAVLFAAAAAFGQGQLVFANSSTSMITNGVTGLPAPGSSAQDDAQVGLYVGNVGDPPNTLSLIGNVTNLFSPGRFAGGTRTLDGWTGTVQVQVRCWLASTVYPSYEAALAAAFAGDASVVLGVSMPIHIPLTTPGDPPSLMVNFGLAGFALGQGSAPSAAPAISNAVAVVLATNVNGTRTVRFSALLPPNGAAAAVRFQYGMTSAYGATNFVFVGGSSSPLYAAVSVPLSPGFTYHWNIVATNSLGTATEPDRTIGLTPLNSGVAGDLNGDGFVSQSELDAVYASYVTNNPVISMTNVIGLGRTNVTFANPTAELRAYSVEYSTNLTDWSLLGSVTPRYGFTDTNASVMPVRQYRLRHP